MAIAAAEDRKVPPRHPEQRLNKLREFANKFRDVDCIPKELMKPRQCNRLAEKMLDFAQRMEDSFNRETCGFYDASLGPHGGPDPNANLKPNGKPRNRRDYDVEYDFMAIAAKEACDEIFEAGQADSYCTCYQAASAYGVAEILANSPVTLSESTCPEVRAKGNKKEKSTPFDRLSNDTPLKWRQITTGYRKWGERYLSNCSGQRKNKMPQKTAMRMYKKWGDRMGFDI